MHAANVDYVKVGDRVQLHPATDRWMMGDRFGLVTAIGRTRISVRLDKSGRTIRFSSENIGSVVYD